VANSTVQLSKSSYPASPSVLVPPHPDGSHHPDAQVAGRVHVLTRVLGLVPRLHTEDATHLSGTHTGVVEGEADMEEEDVDLQEGGILTVPVHFLVRVHARLSVALVGFLPEEGPPAIHVEGSDVDVVRPGRGPEATLSVLVVRERGHTALLVQGPVPGQLRTLLIRGPAGAGQGRSRQGVAGRPLPLPRRGASAETISVTLGPGHHRPSNIALYCH